MTIEIGIGFLFYLFSNPEQSSIAIGQREIKKNTVPTSSCPPGNLSTKTAY
jgi:hypothetical protein